MRAMVASEIMLQLGYQKKLVPSNERGNLHLWIASESTPEGLPDELNSHTNGDAIIYSIPDMMAFRGILVGKNFKRKE